jgi:hypothetical protein
MFKNNSAMLDEVRNCFEGAKGIEFITTNPLTGSVVINYDAQVMHPDQIIQILKDCEYIDEDQSTDLDNTIDQSMSKAGKWIGRACLSLAMDAALEGTGLSFVAALI